MHGTRNRRKYRHCKKPPNDKPPSEEEIQAARSRILRQHIAHLMRRSGFFDESRSDAEIEAERERLAVEYSRHFEPLTFCSSSPSSIREFGLSGYPGGLGTILAGR